MVTPHTPNEKILSFPCHAAPRWALLALLLVRGIARAGAVTAELVDARKIWDEGAHNAFT